jgi:hypothetical protein
MMTSMLRPLALVLSIPVIAAGLFGCSGKTDDVRLVLCKEVTDRMLMSMRPIEWKGNSHRIKRPEFAVIHLDFTINKAGWEGKTVTSECYFEYDTVEENVITHVDELSAYSTLPYKMTIQGKAVPKLVLQQAVSQEQIEGLSEFMDKVVETHRKLQSM